MAELKKTRPQVDTPTAEIDTLSRSPSAESLLIDGVPVYPRSPRSKFVENLSNGTPRKDLTPSRSATSDTSRTANIPNYPAVPKLESSNTTEKIHGTHALTIPRRPVPKSSLTTLTTVVEHRPPTYQSKPTPTPPSSTKAVVGVAENTEEEDAITSLPKLSAQEPCTGTSTMSSISAQSHKEPGPIYFRPSSQLRRMQSAIEDELTPRQASPLNSPWAGLRNHHRTQTEQVYTPSGTPDSLSDAAISRNSVYEAHSRLETTLSRPGSDEQIDKVDWTKSSEWVAPPSKPQHPRDWIEDFLLRQEEADRAEEEEERRRKAQERKDRSLKKRVNSIDTFAFVRRLSGKGVEVENKGGFEARQERLGTIQSVVEFGGAEVREGRLSFEEDGEEEFDMMRERSIPKRAASPPQSVPKQETHPSPQPPAARTEQPHLRKSQRPHSAYVHPMAMPAPKPHKPKRSSLRPSWTSVESLKQEVRRSCSTGGENVKALGSRLESLSGSLKGRVGSLKGSMKGRISVLGRKG
jgi:hypothetical protein